MDWAKIIIEIRNKKFLTQTELAQILDVSFATINRWENRKFEPSMKEKRKIKDYCIKNKLNIGGLEND